MTDVSQLITDHLDIWTSAIEKKSGARRGNGGGISLYGIKKLRDLVLELAVQGKLVPQDPAEGNSTDLLEAIEQSRLDLVKQKKVKNQKGITPVAEEEFRFLLPNGWAWTRLSSLAEISPRNDVEDSAVVSFVPMPDIHTSHTGEHGHAERRWGEIKKSYTHFADGDIALAKITPCFENSKAAVFSNLHQGVGAGTTELHVARPYSNEIVPRFILLHLKAPSFLENGKAVMTGSAGQKRVPRWYFADTPIALPPTAEQHRIVAKVDELMALCDMLEAQAEGSLKAHQTLVETCLAALTNSQTPEDLAQNWARLEANFDALFTTEESVEKLRQTIYLLAVKGKLVAQVPDEVSAQHLLQEVADRRLELLEAGYPNEKEAKTQIKKSEKQTVPEELPEIPPGWEWATLMQASLMVIDCKNKTAPYSEDGVRLIRTTNVRNGRLNDTDQKYVDEKTFEAWSLRAKPEPGDLLITREAPMGEACLIPEGERLCLGQRMMLARLVPDTINKDYLLITFLAPDLMDRVQDKPLGMTVEHLRVGGVETLLVPVPPKAEQARIVDRVHRLVALCDEVKTRVQIAQGLQKALSDTLVERAA